MNWINFPLHEFTPARTQFSSKKFNRPSFLILKQNSKTTPTLGPKEAEISNHATELEPSPGERPNRYFSKPSDSAASFVQPIFVRRDSGTIQENVVQVPT